MNCRIIINHAISCEQHLETVKNIKSYANKLLNCIKFTEDIGFNNGKSINILNTTIHIKNNGIRYNIYKKPTKINIYLSTKSFHAPSTFKSVAIGLAHMFCIKCIICVSSYVLGIFLLNAISSSLLKLSCLDNVML